MVGPVDSLTHLIKRIVASDDAKILTMLLPIKSVDKTLSNLSSRSITLFAFLLPSSASAFIFEWLKDEYAVSVA
jgi:hypothetical protein